MNGKNKANLKYTVNMEEDLGFDQGRNQYIQFEIPLVPIYRTPMPLGVSLFQCDAEYQDCCQQYGKLTKRFDEHLIKIKKKQKEEEKISKEKVSI